MRTTLKRGAGRAHEWNGNGKMQLPPGQIVPVTIYRQPEPPRRTKGRLALSIVGWGLTAILVCVVGVAGGAYLYAPRDGRRGRGAEPRREGRRRRSWTCPSRASPRRRS